MKKILTLTFWALKLALLIAIIWWFWQNPGQIKLDWLGYQVQASVGFAALLLALAMFVFGVVYHFYRQLLALPAWFRDYKKLQHYADGYQALTKSVMGLLAQDVYEAQKYAQKAVALLPDQPLAQWLAAQAALTKEDKKLAATHLLRLQQHPDGALLALRTQLNHALQAGDKAAALAYARQAYALAPQLVWVVQPLVQLLGTSQQWLELERVLRQALKTNVRDAATNKADLAAALLALSQQAIAQKDAEQALDLARQAHQMRPYFAPIIAQVAQIYVTIGDSKKAEKWLREAWAEQPHPSYVALLKTLDPERRGVAWYQFLEKFTASQPQHAQTKLALAEAAVEGALWGIARDHYQYLLANSPTLQVYKGMAALERAEGINTNKMQYWLDQAFNAQPDPAWLSPQGTRWVQWQAVADGEFNALVWGNKPQAPKAFVVGGLLG